MTPPPLLAHQEVGVKALTTDLDPGSGRVIPRVIALFDEMGAGKSKQIIEAAMRLHADGRLQRVFVVCPASVRGVWFDQEFGEITRHGWPGTPVRVTLWHSKVQEWGMTGRGVLSWVITNYDFLRRPERLAKATGLLGPGTWLVLDESAAVKSHTSQQTRACFEVRKACDRATILNGTPVSNGPEDLYSQFAVLDKRIIGAKNYFHFRSREAVMGGWNKKQIIGWRDLEGLTARMAPYVLRRLKEDCLDLPEKMPPSTLTVPLSKESWELYLDMRDGLVAWLKDNLRSPASHAAIKVMRLSQITSGFLGGLIQGYGEEEEAQPPREVGREKLDLCLEWLGERLAADPTAKILVWCRFRLELARMARELQEAFPRAEVGTIQGAQSNAEREQALRLLDPRSAPVGPAIVVGNPAAGSLGLNLTAAATVLWVSCGYSLKERLQADDRVHRPGQVRRPSYFDVVATGPDGQRTIDALVLRAIRNKENVAERATSAWLRDLTEE